MADEIVPGAAPAAEPVVAPEVTIAPAAEVAPAAVEKPAEPAPVAEPVVEAPALKPHTETETLLEGATKKAEEKPAEAVKPEDAKPEDAKPLEGEKPKEEAKAEDKKPEDKPAEEAKPEEPAKPAIVYEDFTLPTGLKPDPEKMAAYQEVAAKFGLPQEGAQELLNLHSTAMQAYADSLAQEQHDAFGEMRSEWRKQVMADDQLGGAGHRTAMAAVARARDALISNAKPGTPQYQADEKAFNDFLRVTGAGDHPVFLRIFHNASRRLDEPAMPPTEIRPPPDNGKAPGKKGMRALYTTETAK